MKLKSNMDMFSVRGDPWDGFERDKFQGRRVLHYKPGEGIWSQLTARQGFVTIEPETDIRPDDEQGPDIDRWTMASFANQRQQARKQSITGKPRPEPVKEQTHQHRAANIMAKYRAGKLANSIKVK